MAPKPGCSRRGRAISPGSPAPRPLAAGIEFGIPVNGTMAHSFIQAHDDEVAGVRAFRAVAAARPRAADRHLRYRTRGRAGRRSGAASAARGDHVSGVRIDSGDLGEHARRVRRILDEGGLAAGRGSSPAAGSTRTQLLALRGGAPIDAFGDRHQPDHRVRCAGARLRLQAAGICRHAAAQALGGQGDLAGPQAGLAALSRATGEFAGDVVTLDGEPHEGEALLRPFMRGGRRVAPPAPLQEVRAHARGQLARLPAALRRLEPFAYPVEIGAGLRSLAAELDRAENSASAPPP